MDGLTLTLLAVIALQVLSAFFSGSETALTAVSKPLMHQMERDGSRAAKRINTLLKTRDRLLGSLLLGNNLVNILASSLAAGLMVGLFGDAGIVYATIGMTAIIVLFGEVLPKTYAIYHANTVALRVAAPVTAVVLVFTPVVRALELIVRLIFRLFGASNGVSVTAEASMMELRGAIEVHAGEAEVREERRMLRSILELADVEVGQVMTHRRNLVTIDGGQPAAAILDQIITSPYTRLPLWRDDPDNIVGVIHAKDMLRAVRTRDEGIEGLDVCALASDPWFIPDSTTLQEQLQAFRQRREHFALVVDEYGSLMGVVTLEDILEEIVGDIVDEHDVAATGVRPQSDGTFIIDGAVPIRDLNREFEWRLPDEEAATIAGLVLHEARRIPEVGQIFRFYGFRFEIARRQRNQITALRVTPPPKQQRQS
ncbi:HlyC/CorC family transporter [Magnetospirillum molischianum]|uniref:Putative HlyC/CorC family of transporters with 2 CBS domains n=1 Tax=Magnetospirillum molischianum DSM 120 TaxID=1150626 RepID=H8FX65_MAGML|nr:HlyC/CorC family transporter [Magnetospirillum molischianum]CCG42953.1 Putative HlyC/CorC family of transporters with 2 CBS domains [Magnetospirillum molischianum DSM 120]